MSRLLERFGWWPMLRFWQSIVVRFDALRRAPAHSRCPGCGAMDEELEGECVGYGISHHPVTVDRYGRPK